MLRVLLLFATCTFAQLPPCPEGGAYQSTTADGTTCYLDAFETPCDCDRAELPADAEFYVVVYCKDIVVPGVMHLMNCPDSMPGCNTVYRRQCRNSRVFQSKQDALDYINRDHDREERHWKFQALLGTQRLSLKRFFKLGLQEQMIAQQVLVNTSYMALDE